MENLIEDADASSLHTDMREELRRQLVRAGDEFLPWQEHVRQCGVVDDWNLRETGNGELARMVIL